MTDPRYMVLYACKWIARDAAKQFFKKDEVNPLSGLLIVLLHFSVLFSTSLRNFFLMISVPQLISSNAEC